jgi:hypothetical protein
MLVDACCSQKCGKWQQHDRVPPFNANSEQDMPGIKPGLQG